MAAVDGCFRGHLHCRDAADLGRGRLTFIDLALDVGKGSFHLINQDQA